MLLLALMVLAATAGTAAEARRDFVFAANLPWRFYGDVGRNAWGHRGFSTEGFAVEQSYGSRGFTEARWVEAGTPSGRPALAITASLAGQSPEIAAGEITTAVGENLPMACPRTVPEGVLNLDGVTARMRLCFPPGSSGGASAPNGIQFVFKSRSASGEFASLYTPWVNVEPTWDGACVDLSFELSNSAPGDRFGAFDATRVHTAGFKFAMNPGSAPTVSGTFHLESLGFETNPPVVFDFSQSLLEKDLLAIRGLAAKMDSAFPVARVFLFVDGRAGIEWDDAGEPAGLDAYALRDLDALVRAAERAQVYLQPVLIDSLWCSRPKQVGGVQLGGHSGLIRDPVRRGRFFEKVVAPLLARYSEHPWIFAWEAGNELEWVTSGVPGFSPDPRETDPVTLFDMQQFVREFAGLARANTRHHATMGSARRSWLALWKDLGLSIYNFHYYESDRAEVFPWRPSADLKLDAPVMVAEVATASTRHAAGSYLRAAREGGYGGLFLWSCRARDAFSDFPAAAADLAARVPVASAEGLAHAASFVTGAPVAPDSWLSLFGEALAPSTTVAQAIPLPGSLDGTTVTVTGGTAEERPTSLLFVSPRQINFLTPPELSGPATITVSRLDGGSASIQVETAPVAPGLFTANANGSGVAAAVAVRVRGGVVAGEELVFRCAATPGSCEPAPIDLGPEGEQVYLLLFGTGIRNRSDLAAVTVWTGSRELTPEYAGAQNQFAGLDQVNVLLPRSLAGSGIVEIWLTVDGKTSNTATVQIR